MFDCVIALGASHIAGFGISNYVNTGLKYMQGEITLEEMDESNKHLAYPALVANHFNIPCYNYAMSGSSNDRTLRLLPQLLLNHPNSLVLIAWAPVDRNEFYIPNEGKFIGRDKDKYLQVGVQFSVEDDDWSRKGHPDELRPEFEAMDKRINKFFVENLMYIDSSNTKICNQLFYADQACKNFAKDFRHIYDSQIFENNTIPEKYKNSLDFKKVLNFSLDKKYDLEKNTGWTKNLYHGTYEDFCNSYFEEVYHGHYGEDAHRAVADLIISSLS